MNDQTMSFLNKEKQAVLYEQVKDEAQTATLKAVLFLCTFLFVNTEYLINIFKYW